MARRYHLSPLPPAGHVPLPADVAHHLARVMRIRVGDEIVLFDGTGQECDATIATISTGRPLSVVADVDAPRIAVKEPAIEVHVAFPPPKGTRAEWVLEHGTEVGISVFRPVTTERSQGHGQDRRDRWTRITTAATGQCDRARIPTVRDTVQLATLLEAPDLPTERYVADADGPPLTAAKTNQAIVLVGPEGGLTTEELQLAEAHGFQRRNLGVTTLRTETAVLAATVRLLQ